MLIKKIKLTPTSGLLTPLQSDTLYGHFCWRLLEVKGEQALAKFIDQYAKGTPVFTVSDGLYEVDGKVLFPRPIIPKNDNMIDRRDPVEKEKKIIELLNKKKERENRYVSLKSLQAFLEGELAEYEGLLETDPAPSPKIIKDLRIHVGIDRNTLTHRDGLLFEQNPEYLDDKTSYAILLKVFDEEAFTTEFAVESIFKDLFEIGFGKKKSSGYGAIEWQGMDEYPDLTEPIEGCNGFYTLGNYLPSKNDGIHDAFYRFFVKYGKLGETGASGPNPFKKPMIMMKPGSCFEVGDAKKFYGRITTPGEISTTDNVRHFGMPFTLNYKKFPKSDSFGDTNGPESKGGTK